MTDVQQRAAAKKFAEYWSSRGDEKQETARFWMDLLQNVYGVENSSQYIEFEVPVKLKHTSFIDAYIDSTKVLIEQKGADIDLKKGARQSDGAVLTPYQQAKRYAGELPHNMNPRWIVVCNFREFEIHDMNRPYDTPETIQLAELETEYPRLSFLVNPGSESVRKEMQVSLQAGEIVGVLYDALLKKYINPGDPETLRSLNALCVRLVFCLYAEDAGIFGRRGMFHDYLESRAANARSALIDLFRVLDTPEDKRDPYMDDDLAAFPYVNGGLFADESVVIPRLDTDIVDLILHRASEGFNWSEISPTIFGAVFESTLNPETRRSGGMHYTSIENIHKVIDPLFFDDLRTELDDILEISVERTRRAKLEAFQNKLASLTFLDPACGSGNFLTETYLSLRRLENEAISALHHDQITLDIGNPIKVSIGQFYGIEINDFAVTVAKTALWIAESQMMKETEDVVHMSLDFLPLRSYANIVEGNALRLDWESVVDKMKLNYIMGNPPFVGASMMTTQQKAEAVAVFGKGKRVNSIDYVGAWYHKAARLMLDTNIRGAFVSTNSITQGEQVAPLWGKLLKEYHVHIDFAYRTFRWSSESRENAAVHCVIIGFSIAVNDKERKIYLDNAASITADNINSYLIDAPNMLIESRSKPISNVPPITYGNKPSDGGNLILSQDERDALLKADPSVGVCVRQYMGSKEFINGGEPRYCLWLKGIAPSVYYKNTEIMRRLDAVREMRLKSSAAPTRAMADKPYLFFSTTQTDSNYLCIPEVSSERRKYIPIGFLDSSIIASNKLLIVPDATLYHFGILTSNVHMAWMRTVTGRMKSDYQYSGAIVYNNFPWPTPTDEQRAKIEQTAQAILDARSLYTDSSLAILYDDRVMPSELRKAHQDNDRAVMRAYGFSVRDTTEASCVAELMRMYERFTEGKG